MLRLEIGGPEAGSLMVTVRAALVAPVTPKTTLPNAIVRGETVSPVAEADAAEDAIAPMIAANASVRTARAARPPSGYKFEAPSSPPSKPDERTARSHTIYTESITIEATCKTGS